MSAKTRQTGTTKPGQARPLRTPTCNKRRQTGQRGSRQRGSRHPEFAHHSRSQQAVGPWARDHTGTATPGPPRFDRAGSVGCLDRNRNTRAHASAGLHETCCRPGKGVLKLRDLQRRTLAARPRAPRDLQASPDRDTHNPLHHWRESHGRRTLIRRTGGTTIHLYGRRAPPDRDTQGPRARPSQLLGSWVYASSVYQPQQMEFVAWVCELS